MNANRVLKVLGTLALVAIVLPFAAVGGANLADGYSSHVVVSGSMEPSIGVGDVVIIDHSPGEIQQGEVITYGRGDDRLPTTHRVVDITTQDGQTVYVTKGDANEDRDPTPVQRQQVVGEVFLTVPYIGHVLTFADTAYGFAALVVVPIGLLILNELWVMFTAANGSDGDASDDSGSDDDGGEGTPGPSESGENGETVTLTASELQLALVPTAVLAAFSGWVTYDTRSGVAAAITTAAGVSLLFGLGIVVTSEGTTDETASGSESDVTAGTLPTVPAPVSTGDAFVVPVNSVDAVAACAQDMDRCVVWDPAVNEWYLPNDDHIYHCQSAIEQTHNEPPVPTETDSAAPTAGTSEQAATPENGSSMQGESEAVEYEFEEGTDDT